LGDIKGFLLHVAGLSAEGRRALESGREVVDLESMKGLLLHIDVLSAEVFAGCQVVMLEMRRCGEMRVGV
jgi:hypothetical protein